MKKPINEYLVTRNASIREVLACIDRNASGIALVVDSERRLLGTATDGDVRRALLKGAALESPIEPHMQKKFTVVGVEADRVEVLDRMRARSIKQLPIVDEKRRLVGLHSLSEIIGAVERPNPAVIMAGGKGERLRPITERIPKPMIRVAGRPILERLVLHLVGFGIRQIFISVHFLGEIIQDHFGDGAAFGCSIEYLKEEKPLGSGGALSLLPKRPRAPLLVVNGDLITQADIGALLEFHEEGEYIMTVCARDYSHTVPYGCLETEGDRLIRLEEKPVLNRLINAGIYVLSPEVLNQLPSNPEFPLTALIDRALAADQSVGVYPLSGDWIDVGLSDQLRLAQRGEAAAHEPTPSARVSDRKLGVCRG